MAVNFFSTLENVHTLVNRTALDILDHLKDKKLKTKYLNELQEVLESCVACEHKVAILRQATKEAIARSRDESTGVPVVALFDDLIEESTGELQQDSPLEEALVQAPCLKTFKDLQDKYNEEEDDDNEEDLITTDCRDSLIDPISKKLMKDPVRNKRCQHVYERSSVTSMISARSSKNGFKCPAIGCSNRQPMKLSDLEDARDVRMQLSLQMNDRNK